MTLLCNFNAKVESISIRDDGMNTVREFISA